MLQRLLQKRKALGSDDAEITPDNKEENLSRNALWLDWWSFLGRIGTAAKIPTYYYHVDR